MSVFRRKIRGLRAKNYSAKFMYRGQMHRQGGFPDRETAQHWIDSTRISMRRGEAGFIKPRTAAKIAPLIEEFADHLRTLKRSDKYAETTENRLNLLAANIPWMTLADFTAFGFERWRSAGPKYKNRLIKAQTLNQYLDHAQVFGDWLVKPKQLLAHNPLKAIDHITAIVNTTYRRAASLEELTSLLSNSPPKRSMVYRFLIYIPLRRRAMKAIEWRDFVLDGERPTFTLRPELSKSGRVAKLAIPLHLATALAAYRGDAEADDRVFTSIPTIETLKRDLIAAKVPFDDGRGERRLDLHAFRKTVTRLLKKAGVSLDEVHVFLQHRDRRTTERFYDDDLVSPEITVAAQKMPEINVGTHLAHKIDYDSAGGAK